MHNWQALTGSVAEDYHRHLVEGLFLPWAIELVELVDLKEGEHVMDVACGPGTVTRLIAERVGISGRTLGLDINEEMITFAQSIPTPVPIEWMVGSGTDMPLANAAFDAVVCQQGLQFFPDRARGLAEMRRVLKKEGRLGIAVWGPIERSVAFTALRDVRARLDTPEAAAFIDTAFSLNDPQELKHLVEQAGFHEVKVRTLTKTAHYDSPETFAVGVAGSTLAQADPETFKQLVADLARELRDQIDEEGLSDPIESNLVTALA